MENKMHRREKWTGKLLQLLVALTPAMCVAGGAAAEQASAAPILEYQFDGSGTSAASTGTNTTALQMKLGVNLVDLHGAAGSGVSGQSDDKALDLSGVNGMGNNSSGGSAYATSNGKVSDINALQSFTLTGWFKTSTTGEQFGRFARLFDHKLSDGALNGFDVMGSGGAITMSVNNIQSNSPVSYGEANKWIFFAVTYDGTSSTNNLKYYRGYRNQTEAGSNAVFSLVATATLNAGAVVDQAGSLIVGNTDGQTRPFRGFLDDMRIYGSKTDASGALPQQLVQDVHGSAVPEPAALGLLGLGVPMLLRRRR